MKKDLVTRKQALLLKQLGYKELCNNYIIRTSKEEQFGNIIVTGAYACNRNSQWYLLSVPTVDEVIYWLCNKFNIIVYNSYAPFVDPATKSFIWYGFAVKKCNLMKWGWNARLQLGRTHDYKSVYAAKRNAIDIALKYLVKSGSVATSRQKVIKTKKRSK